MSIYKPSDTTCQKKFYNKVEFYTNTIAPNPNLHPTTKFVASVLLFKFHNTANGACFPSEDKIAAASGMTVRTLQRAIRELRDQGAVRVKRRYNKSNEYYFDFNDDKSVVIDQNLMTTNLVVNDDKYGGINDDKYGVLTLESNTGNNSLSAREIFPLHKKIDSSLHKNEIPFTHESNNSSSPKGNNPVTREDDNSSSHKNSNSAADDWFEQFWAVYPRHVGRNESLREFAAALKRGVDPEQIIHAAAGYAQTRKKKKQPEYDKYPVNWLQGEHWNDELSHTFKQQEPPKARNTNRCTQCDKTVVSESKANPFYCDDCQGMMDEFAAEVMQQCEQLRT